MEWGDASASAIAWPPGHEPAGAAIHAVNLGASSAPPEAIWAWLVRPESWPAYYRNALRIRHLEGDWPVVAPGTRFSWITFGVRVETVVTEFEPARALAWTGTGLGATGHHVWLLDPVPGGGAAIRTEETQRGLAPRALAPVLRPAMVRMHQRWIEGLSEIALSGRTP